MWDRWMPKKLQIGDVLLTSEAPLGQAAFLKEAADYCLGQRLFALRASPDHLDSQFLYYSLISPQMQDRLQVRASGTTAQGIRQAELVKVPIDLPAISEQRRIAWVLGALDDKIELNRRMARTLEETAAAIFKARFVDFEGVEEFEDSEIGLIPKGWKVSGLGEITELHYGKALAAKSRRAGYVPVVGSSGVVGWHDSALVSHPGVILGRKGTAGKVTWSDGPFFPIDTTFFSIPADGISPLFIYFCFLNIDFDRWVSDSAVPGLNRDMALSIPTAIPPMDWIEDFTDVARPLMASRKRLLSEATTLVQLRDELLPKLISGKIRVPEGVGPDADADEVLGEIAQSTAGVEIEPGEGAVVQAG